MPDIKYNYIKHFTITNTVQGEVVIHFHSKLMASDLYTNMVNTNLKFQQEFFGCHTAHGAVD